MNFQSHGLGLNICKRIAKGLGGDLVLNEEIVRGCEFILTFPVEKIDLNRGAFTDDKSSISNDEHSRRSVASHPDDSVLSDHS